MKRKILSILLCIAVCMTMMPAMGYATEEENASPVTYNWKVAGTPVTSDNASDVLGDGKISYDATSNTLTLNGATINNSNGAGITCGSSNEKAPVIKLQGENKIEALGDGIELYNSATTALTIKSEDSKGKLTVTGGNSGISLEYPSALTLSNVEVAATGTTEYGIYAKGNISLDHATVTATAEAATDSYSTHCGIKSEGKLTLTKSSISAKRGNGSSNNIEATGGIIAEEAEITGAYYSDTENVFTSGKTKELRSDNEITLRNNFVDYDLWVGGVRVTSKNADGITGTGISTTDGGKVSYDANSNTLTLNNANITGSHKDGNISAAIMAVQDAKGNYHDINIKLVGTNRITNINQSAEEDVKYYGIYSPKDISVTNGSSTDSVATVTIESNDDAIRSGNTTALSNVTVTATGTTGDGIHSDHNITIEKASIIAKGVNGIQSGYDITAGTNSTVEAVGTTGYGIVANNNISLQNSDIEAKCNSGDAIVSRNGEITCTPEMSPIKNGTNVYAENEPTHIIKALKSDEWVSLKRTTNSLYYNTEDGQVYTSYDEKTNTFSDKWDRGGITGSTSTLTLKDLYFVTTAKEALVIPVKTSEDTITINCEGKNIICAGYNGNVEDYGIQTDANLIINGGTLSMSYSNVYSSIKAGGDIQLVDTDVTVCRFIAGGKLTLENAILHAMGYSNPYSIDTGNGIYYYDNLYAAKGDDIACEKLSDSNIISKLGKASLTLFSETFAYFDANGGKWEDEKGSAIIRSESKQEGKRWITIPDAPTRNGYNFIGWFTEKDGGTQITENKIEYKGGTDKSTALVHGHDFSGYAEVPANTYYAHWTYSGGGSGGGGAVIPAPTTPDSDVVTVKDDKTGASEEGKTTTTKTTINETKTETTKNEQGQNVSKTTAAVSKETAEKLVDQAVSNKSDTVEITVKSGAASGNTGNEGAASGASSTEVEIPKSAVESIAKNTDADLVIKTDSGEVTLDNKTLETIAKESKGDTVTIVVNENTKLTEAQKPAEKIIGEKGKLFDLAASIGEKLIHHFDGGKAHVTLPMPEDLKGKDVLVIYINDKGFCEILSHAVEKVGADSYIKFTTSHFSTFAVVDKEEAEALIKAQNDAHVKELMQTAKFKVTTSKTGKKSVKVTVTAKNSKTLISDIKAMGYTVKYQFYRSTKKASGYKLLNTKTTNSFTNTTGKKGTKYYYKARVLVYDGKTLVAKSQLKQASYGARTWTKQTAR